MRTLVLALLAVSLMGGGCELQVFAPAGVNAVGSVLNAMANTVGVFAAQATANILLPLFETVDPGAISAAI